MNKIVSLFLFMVILSLFFSSCEIKSPAAPSWEVTFTLPLINENYPLIRLATGSDSLNIRLSLCDIHSREGYDWKKDDAWKGCNICDDVAFMYFYDDGDFTDADIHENDFYIRENITGTENGPLTPNFTGTLVLTEGDGDIEISLGVIRKGSLNFLFSDVPASITEIEIVFRELYDENDERLKLVIKPPFNNYQADITNHTMTDKGGTQLIVKNLNYTVTLSPGGISGGFMRIYYMEPIIFSYIEGLLHDYEISAEFDSINLDMEFPENIENAVDLLESTITVYIDRKIGFDSWFHATATSYNDRNPSISPVSMPISGFIKGLNLGETSLEDFPLIFDHEKDNIDELMNIAPDRIEITNARFVLNNADGRIGFAHSGQPAHTGRFDTVIPFKFDFNANEPIRLSESQVKENRTGISEGNRDDIRDRARGAAINMTFKNMYAADAYVTVFISSSSDPNLVYVRENVSNANFSRLVFPDPSLMEIDPDLHQIYLPRGTADIANTKNFSFNLVQERNEMGVVTRDDFAIFYTHEEIFVGIEFEFADGTSILLPKQSIDVIGNLKFDLFIDFND
ncbi:MAG: hypothetical protein FWG98_08850 [Candidatus Cloacimonetes bacterium]|nr:hypothetical protein [Candidatus Cloacimonadota bacterium]